MLLSNRPTSSFASLGRGLHRFFRANYGPVKKAFEALDRAGQERLYDGLADLARRHDRADGPSVAIPASYIEAVAVRR